MTQLRSAVGLRRLSAAAQTGAAKADKVALASFKQYREKDGQFYFKLVDAQGQTILQSLGFSSPKDAGQAIARLQMDGLAALPDLKALLEPLDSAREQDLQAALAEIAKSKKAN
jgi:tryptophanyl-tRNA synthetase